MKRLTALLSAAFCTFALIGCTPKEPSVEISDDVNFELLDVMTITNDESNSIYYYYMAQISNDSKGT